MKKKISKFYLLGAGRPHSGDEHSGLHNISNSSQVIDWTLHAISYLKTKTYFVCGYKSREVKASYPGLNYLENKDWEKTKSGWSFLTAISKSAQNTLVSYSDIVFRESAVKKIFEIDQDIVVTIDSKWQSRYSGRDTQDLTKCEKVCFLKNEINLLGPHIDLDKANAEFIGLVYFSK